MISVLGQTRADQADLPDGGVLENDVVPAVQRGVSLGGTVGLLAGLAAVTITPGVVAAGAAIALTSAGGASLGALASALVGASVPNSQLREYTEALERGNLLLIVEVEDSTSGLRQTELLEEFPALVFFGEKDNSIPVM